MEWGAASERDNGRVWGWREKEKKETIWEDLRRADNNTMVVTILIGGVDGSECNGGRKKTYTIRAPLTRSISTEDVKKTCSTCRICAELKPQFYRPTPGTLIKSTQPMERLSIDFKGPLPTTSRNAYILKYLLCAACLATFTLTVVHHFFHKNSTNPCLNEA